MKNIGFLLFGSLLILSSCGDDKKGTETKADTKEEVKTFDDSKYVLSDAYPVGDVRRYGIFPDSAFASKHPYTKETKMKTVLDLAEQNSIELFFPEGFYGRGLFLDARKNITINFDKAAFKVVHITSKNGKVDSPENINLKGELITYDRLGITDAKNITIDTVYIKSDVKKNGTRARGCHIYYGTKNISINYLEIDDLGSGDKASMNNHAALAIDGYKNNPIGVKIKKVYIKSSDRHGVYLTGSEHEIGEIVIDKFGVGASKFMRGMGDSSSGEEKQFAALWINRCYDSFINKVVINEKQSKGKYSINFDEGDATRPVEINSIEILNNNSKIKELIQENNKTQVGNKNY